MKELSLVQAVKRPVAGLEVLSKAVGKLALPFPQLLLTVLRGGDVLAGFAAQAWAT